MFIPFLIIALFAFFCVNIITAFLTYFSIRPLVQCFLKDLKDNPKLFQYRNTQYGTWLEGTHFYDSVCLDDAICLTHYSNHSICYIHKSLTLFSVNLLSYYYYLKICKQLKLTFPNLTLLR